VLIAGFPAGAFAANCYVVAPAPGEECLIIDPGQDAEAGIAELTGRYRLRPAAVLLTHGHIDHVWSVAPVCGARGIPAYIHPADRELLSDPARGLPLAPFQELFGGLTFTEPDDVVELAGAAADSGTLFTGDLLFAGSIGRVDLPGGDYATILESLARVCLPLPDETVVLSGHGPQTTIGAERSGNPYLTGLTPSAGPGRGL